MNKTALPLLLFVSFAVSPLSSQETSLRAPQPRLSPAPPSCSWQILCHYTKKDEPPAGEGLAAIAASRRQQANPRLVQIDVVKHNSQREEISLFANGQKSTVWVDGDIMVARYRRFPSLSHARAGDSGSPDFRNDFMDLAWIEDAAYLGLKSFEGKQCHVYRGQLDEEGMSAEAWIADDSGLPVRIVFPDCVRIYTFRSGGSAISFPDDVAHRLADLRKSENEKSE